MFKEYNATTVTLFDHLAGESQIPEGMQCTPMFNFVILNLVVHSSISADVNNDASTHQRRGDQRCGHRELHPLHDVGIKKVARMVK